MNAPWLFAEAYKYRRLHECFSVSKYWGDYDVFYRQKVLRVSVLSKVEYPNSPNFSVTRSLARQMLCLSCR